jgi:hypothetical protein
MNFLDMYVNVITTTIRKSMHLELGEYERIRSKIQCGKPRNGDKK